MTAAFALPFRLLALCAALAVGSGAQALSVDRDTRHPLAKRADPREASRPWQWQTVASGLEHPWALAFLPDGRFLVTEREGHLRIVDAQGQLGAPIGGLPPIAAGGQGGLLDVVIDEDFARNRRLYLCLSKPGDGGEGGSSTALVEAVLSEDEQSLQQLKTLFSQQPKVRGGRHFGCRIALSPTHIYMGMGDRGSESAQAQSPANGIGAIVRLMRDGSVPADNPWQAAGQERALWSIGHRNIQGMAFDAEGRLWAHEHGAQGGDEINFIQRGRNYGWPTIAYGKDYGGAPIGEGLQKKEGMEQPLYYWDPSMAPSGMAFVSDKVDGNPYGADWVANLLVGSLKFGYVARLRWDGTGGDPRVHAEEKIEVGARVRDVRQGPDGFVYILTDERNGRLLRLMP